MQKNLLESVCLSTKFGLQLKKKTKQKFTFFCRHQKMVVIQFIYTERLINFCFYLYIAKRQLEKTQ